MKRTASAAWTGAVSLTSAPTPTTAAISAAMQRYDAISFALLDNAYPATDGTVTKFALRSFNYH